MSRSADQWGRDAEERPVFTIYKAVALGVVLVLLCIAAVGVATTGSIFFQSAASNATLDSRENLQRNSTTNAVTSITFFHDTCEAYNRQVAVVQTNQARSKRLDGRAAKATDPIAAKQAQDQADAAATDAAGAFNTLAGIATSYNARAANSLNAKFREAGLPERLPQPSEDSIQPVVCG